MNCNIGYTYGSIGWLKLYEEVTVTKSCRQTDIARGRLLPMNGDRVDNRLSLNVTVDGHIPRVQTTMYHRTTAVYELGTV